MKNPRIRLNVAILTLIVLLATALPAAAQLESGGAGQLPPPDSSGDLGSLLSGSDQAGQKDIVAVDAEFTAPTADKPGRLFVTATINSGWHITSITQPTQSEAKGGNPIVSKIEVKLPQGVRVTGPFKAIARSRKAARNRTSTAICRSKRTRGRSRGMRRSNWPRASIRRS